MALGKSASCGVLSLVLLALLLGAEGAMHDRKRGLKTHGLSDAEIKDVMKDHDPHHIIHKHTHREGMQEHPEVKRYLEWREMHKAGHPEAAAAFAGKIPHDFLPHLLEHEAPESEQREEL